MKRIILNLLLLLSSATVAVSQTIDDVLKTIESNNNDIKAAKALYESQTIEARSDNMLGNTSVAYERMLGTRSIPEKSGKVTVTQELDFPSIYAVRGKMNKEKEQLYRYEYEETRRNTLLAAKELCLDLITLNKQQELIRERLKNINNLKALYQKRYDIGDVNQLEINKIKMQEMSETTSLTINQNEINRIKRELATLNNGEELPLNITMGTEVKELPDYASYSKEAVDADMTLKMSTGAYNVAVREHKVARNSWLPSLDISYIREMRPAETSNGFEIGFSMPLWNNLRNVNKTKAYKTYAMWQIEKTNREVESSVMTNYEEAQKLWEAIQVYDINLVYDNIRLLNKTLEAKEISMIEYFMEINSLYETLETYNTLQNSYNKALAKMYKYKL